MAQTISGNSLYNDKKRDYDKNNQSKLALHKEIKLLMVEEWRWRCEKQEWTPKGT